MKKNCFVITKMQGSKQISIERFRKGVRIYQGDNKIYLSKKQLEYFVAILDVLEENI